LCAIISIVLSSAENPTSRSKNAPRSYRVGSCFLSLRAECSEAWQSGCGRQTRSLSFRGATQLRRGNLSSSPCHSERSEESGDNKPIRPVILNETQWSEPTPSREQKELCSFCRDAKEEDRRSRIWLWTICPFVLSFRTNARNLCAIISIVLSSAETPTVGLCPPSE